MFGKMSSDGCTDSKVQMGTEVTGSGSGVHTGPVMMETWGQTDTGVLSKKDLYPKPWTEDDEDEKVHRVYPWPAHIKYIRFPDGRIDCPCDSDRLIKKVQAWQRAEYEGKATITNLQGVMIIDEIVQEPRVRLTPQDIKAISKESARRSHILCAEANVKSAFFIWWYRNRSQFQLDRLCSSIRRLIEACRNFEKANRRFRKYLERFIKIGVNEGSINEEEKERLNKMTLDTFVQTWVCKELQGYNFDQ